MADLSRVTDDELQREMDRRRAARIRERYRSVIESALKCFDSSMDIHTILADLTRGIDLVRREQTGK